MVDFVKPKQAKNSIACIVCGKLTANMRTAGRDVVTGQESFQCHPSCEPAGPPDKAQLQRLLKQWQPPGLVAVDANAYTPVQWQIRDLLPLNRAVTVEGWGLFSAASSLVAVPLADGLTPREVERLELQFRTMGLIVSGQIAGTPAAHATAKPMYERALHALKHLIPAGHAAVAPLWLVIHDAAGVVFGDGKFRLVDLKRAEGDEIAF